MTRYYRAIFTFDKNIPHWLEDICIDKYQKLRSIAVDAINPHFEEWNDAYEDNVHEEDDAKYDSYICEKQREILRQVFGRRPRIFRLDADEQCDLILRIFGNVTMTMELEPVDIVELRA